MISWEPTIWERVIGIVSAGGILYASGSFALASFLDSDPIRPIFWIIPLTVALVGLLVLVRLLWTRKRGLSKLALMITAMLFLCAGLGFAYIAVLSDGVIRTAYLGSVAVVCTLIGSYNLLRPWKRRAT